MKDSLQNHVGKTIASCEYRVVETMTVTFTDGTSCVVSAKSVTDEVGSYVGRLPSEFVGRVHVKEGPAVDWDREPFV